MNSRSAFTKSARLSMPTRRPSRMTGRRLMRCFCISRAASLSVSFSLMVTGDLVMTSATRCPLVRL